MTKQPFLPLFFGDFLAATAEWTGEEQGLYLLLLGHQWSLGSLPSDADKLCRLVRWDRKLFLRCWKTVSSKFTEKDGRLLNDRLELHRAHADEISQKRAAAGAKGAAKRHSKYVANAKQLPEQTPSNCQANAEILPCHPNQTKPIDSEVLRTSGAEAPSGLPTTDPRKALWDLGKTLLGPKSGGLISAAIKRVGEEKVAEVLGFMATKAMASPVPYFEKATAPKERGFVC